MGGVVLGPLYSCCYEVGFQLPAQQMFSCIIYSMKNSCCHAFRCVALEKQCVGTCDSI